MIAQPEDPPAEQPEVGSRPQQDGQHQVAPHLSVACGGGIDEQGHRDHRPEQQIQKPAQQGQMDAHPQNAEGVVQQAHRRAHQQGTGEEEGLLSHRDGHFSGTAGRTGRGPAPARCPHR